MRRARSNPSGGALRAVALALAGVFAGALAGCAATAVDPGADLARPVVIEGDGTFDEDPRTIVAPWIADHVATGGAAAYLDDAAYELEVRLRDAGHPFASVDYAVEADDGPVVFRIDAGPLVAIDSFEIVGADWLGADLAAAYFEFPRANVAGDRRPVFSERALQSGIDELDATYYDAGFLDVTIEPAVVDVDRASARARVRVVVVQGARYTVGSLTLDGAADGPTDGLEDLLRPFRDRPYDPRLPYELRNDLLEFYGNRGRPDADVRFERVVDSERHVVDLAFAVASGPEVHISEVRVVGNRETRRGFITRRVGLAVGDRYSRDAARKGFERLYRTGLFDRVAVKLVEEGGDERALTIEVEETPSQEVFIEPGYGAYELFRLKAGYRERNLFGTGRQLRVQGAVAVRAQGAEIGISDPDFFDTFLFADLSVAIDEREFPSFTRLETSTTFSLRWPWTTHLKGAASYQYRASDITEITVVDGELLGADDDVDVSSISFNPRYDSRDRLFVPHSGQVSSFGVEYASAALGSELDFVRTTLKASRYFPFDDDGDTILAIGGEVGGIFPVAATETIPLQERFFNGGAKTVRAFKQYELGPLDSSGEKIGGEGYSLVSVELRQRLFGRIQGALFSDYGNVVLDADDLPDFEDYEGGFGIGLRYVLPVGPLRVDVAFNPDADPDQDDFVIHVAVGMPF